MRPKVFISYAHEDKDPFVRELVEAMTEKGIDVWWDEFELLPGDSLLSSIARGLSQAKYGLVILSKNYLSPHKKWTHAELDGIFALDGERQHLLPVLYEMSPDELRDVNPVLAGRLCIVAKDLETAVNGILRVVAPHMLKASPFRVELAVKPWAVATMVAVGVGVLGLGAILGFASGSAYRLATVYLAAGLLLSHVMHILIYVNIDRRRGAISDTRMQAYYFWPVSWKLCLGMAFVLPVILLCALVGVGPTELAYHLYWIVGAFGLYEIVSQAFGSSLIRLGFEGGLACVAAALVASDAAVKAGVSACGAAAGLALLGAVALVILVLASRRILHKYFESSRFKQSEMVRYGIATMYVVGGFALSAFWVIVRSYALSN